MALVLRKFTVFSLWLILLSCATEEDKTEVFCSNPLFPFFCPSAGKCCSLPVYGRNVGECYSSLSECASTGQSCESCTIEPNNTVAQAYIYANWDCAGSTACEAAMGGTEGTAGPFCEMATCTSWGEKFAPGAYTCVILPSHSPGIGLPPNGKCFEVGDF